MHGRTILVFICAILLATFAQACQKIKGAKKPVSPVVHVVSPTGTLSGNVSIVFRLIDEEMEEGSVTIEFSTDNGGAFTAGTLAVPGEGSALSSGWFPGCSHTIQWNSVVDMVGRSEPQEVVIRVTPSDASNPSGDPDTTAVFTINNLAFNEAPGVTVTQPDAVECANIRIDYRVSDMESDNSDILVEYTADGSSWQNATVLAGFGDPTTDLATSPVGQNYFLLWDSVADNVGTTMVNPTVSIRITAIDALHAGTPDTTDPFSVDNFSPNDAPLVTITSGPANGSATLETSVTIEWSGSDTDGTVAGYFYSVDGASPYTWTDQESLTLSDLAYGWRNFRIMAMDNANEFSTEVDLWFYVNRRPTVTVTGGPVGDTLDNTPTFLFSGSDPGGSIDGYYVSIDANPPDTWTIGTSYTPMELEVGGHTFYVIAVDDFGANSSVASRSFNVKPAFKTVNIQYITTWSATGDRPYAIQLVGNNLFVIYYDGVFEVLDVSNPASPSQISDYPGLGASYDLKVSGDTAYIVSWETFRLFDVSNLSSPSLIRNYVPPGSPYLAEVTVVGDYAYLSTYDSNVRIIDVSNPSNPVETGTYLASGRPKGIHVEGDTAYVAYDTSGLKVLDVSDKWNPTEIGSFSTVGSFRDVVVQDDLAYIADLYSGLLILDVSTPSNPQNVGSVNVSDIPVEVTLSESYAFVCNSQDGLSVFNVADPSNPTPAGTYPTNPNHTVGVCIGGDYAYLAVDGVGIIVLRVFD